MYHICPIWVYPTLPSICNKTSKYIPRTDIAKKIKPSQRGELEITSINTEYLKKDQLRVELLDKSFTWLDSGTHESMLEASNFIHTIEKRTGLKIACVEEIAFKLGYINSDQFKELIKSIGKNQYGNYLKSILFYYN